MATKKQKDELLATLKFTPRTYNIYIGGYGGEAYAGKVDRAVYDYFKQKRIDIEQYATDWDDLFSDVPRELQPYSPGSPYDCDGLFHASGAELSNLNEIQVNDEHGNEHWTCAAGLNELEDAGVEVNEWGGCDFDDLPEDTVVHWGGQGEKGTFFDGEIELTQPFDPKKLTIKYENCDGWWIINSVEYDGVEIDGSGGYSTTGKWNENKWILCNGDEVYQGEERSDDDDEDEDDEAWDPATDGVVALENAVDELQAQFGSVDDEWNPAAELDQITEDMMTEWYPVDTKPVRKGEYEVRNTHTPAWPFPATFRAEWTGRTWKDSEGNKVPNIVDWRGLAEDPDKLVTFECECVQCDWRGVIDDTHDEDGEMRCPECGEPVELK
jgi:hypothetical protein